ILSIYVLVNKTFTYRTTRHFIIRKEFKESERKKVIIVTTWRSGSTFLEELIGPFQECLSIMNPS
ncbi:hypothetical protein Avbf_15067, partial [Armadillidium vulgare]